MLIQAAKACGGKNARGGLVAKEADQGRFRKVLQAILSLVPQNYMFPLRLDTDFHWSGRRPRGRNPVVMKMLHHKLKLGPFKQKVEQYLVRAPSSRKQFDKFIEENDNATLEEFYINFSNMNDDDTLLKVLFGQLTVLLAQWFENKALKSNIARDYTMALHTPAETVPADDTGAAESEQIDCIIQTVKGLLLASSHAIMNQLSWRVRAV